MKSKHFMANTAQVPNLFNFQGHRKTLIDNRQFDPFRSIPNRDVFTFARLQLIIIMSQLNTGSYTIGVVGGGNGLILVPLECSSNIFPCFNHGFNLR